VRAFLDQVYAPYATDKEGADLATLLEPELRGRFEKRGGGASMPTR
jgi:hypothetical protein